VPDVAISKQRLDCFVAKNVTHNIIEDSSFPYPPPADKERPPLSGAPALCPNRNGTRAGTPLSHNG